MFGKSTSRWIKYSEYEANQAKNGDWYISPTLNATSAVYDPIENVETMIVDALNIGLKCMSSAKQFYDDNRMIAEMCNFAEKYGLLGFMTALPSTPEFMDYETVYLPKNRFIREQVMPSIKYARLFFPFYGVAGQEGNDNPSSTRASSKNANQELNTDPNPYRHYTKDDGSLMVSLAARNKPKAIEMSYQRSYSESHQWLRTQFADWALVFGASHLYYELENTDPEFDLLQRQAITAFDGNVPSFHIELFDKPTIVWDFKSLMTVINAVFGLMLTDDARPLRPCKYCNRAFIAKHPKAEFCEHKCKNKYNVYKSRRTKLED